MQVSINRWLLSRFAKPFAFVLALLPILWLVLAAAMDWLGANPAEALERSTGDWTLRMLCVVLAITPVRTVLQLPGLARFRRMAGLFVYFYAVLHLLTYAWFDMGLDGAEIVRDVIKRPFILVGMLAGVLLTLLTATSFNRAIRWLGGARWRALHRAVYAVAGLAILHFYWMRAGKNNFAEVWLYGAILVALLGWRLWHRLRQHQKSQQTAAVVAADKCY